MKINLRALLTISCLCAALAHASAQRFYNLTSDEVRVDSIVPVFSHTEGVPALYADSVYTFEIAYPEYADMPRADIDNYCRLRQDTPPDVPAVDTRITMDRKRPSLHASFCPVVFRDGRYQVLASFMLRRMATARHDGVAERIARLNSPLQPSLLTAAEAEQVAPADRYARQSVLRQGHWAKIRVPSTGIYQLTDAVCRQAGFADPSKVKVYGYGGNLQDEVLRAENLINCDDLKELPTYQAGGRRLFYGRGPVSWQDATEGLRTRNPYSDYGCYFITDYGDAPQYYADSASFVASFYPGSEWHRQLYEVDGYSYVQVGRNLYDTRAVAAGDSLVITFDAVQPDAQCRLTVSVTSAAASAVDVSLDGSALGSMSVRVSGSYTLGGQTARTYSFAAPHTPAPMRLVLRVSSGSPMRLDYADLACAEPRPLPQLATATFPAAEYVYGITNQNHHADPQADMVIIIPTSQKLLAQAQRVKKLHEEQDSMRVNIVPADELYNEFSSGTPDASAYRHYMKMLYDRAETSADQPKYLLLLGGSVWDNRMKTADCRQLSPDDYLLAYESQNSFDKVKSFVDDGFYATLDDGEGAAPLYADKMDVAVGRMPVVTEADAKAMVDKLVAYTDCANRGAWLNTLFFMGDDGDQNQHMTAANAVADQVISARPGFMVKKVMWDSYAMESTSTGNSYPGVERIIKQQQSQGALIMDYVGHGSEWQFSHENVLHIADFQNFSNANLPLWITVGCDFMPFDRLADNIGMKAVLNPKGGAVAFVGTTRTVYASYNAILHRAFMRQLMSDGEDGLPLSVGEALRRAKNQANDTLLAYNSMEYALLGDPAMRLNMPTASIVVDSICGIPVDGEHALPRMKAGALVSVSGYVEGNPDFDGNVSVTVRDSRETITCRLNQPKEASKAFAYTDRTKTLYSGQNRIRGGRFSVTFAVPQDINYSDDTGLITLWAVSDDRKVMAQGYSEAFTVGESVETANDSIGPSIYCYLNDPSFQNGGKVNTTPYFVAEIKDRDGINASGSGIGHDMQLCIDGRQALTYSLNDNFTFDFGSYTSGSTYYNIPALDEGEHTLRFRAWDILNNVTVSELRFTVVKSQKPEVSISCTDNPATESTTFIIAHDRSGSALDVTVEVFDTSGRMLWSQTDGGVSQASPYTLTWDLTCANGARLSPGVYLYRVKVASDNAVRTSKAKKLIVVGNK